MRCAAGGGVAAGSSRRLDRCVRACRGRTSTGSGCSNPTAITCRGPRPSRASSPCSRLRSTFQRDWVINRVSNMWPMCSRLNWWNASRSRRQCQPRREGTMVLYRLGAWRRLPRPIRWQAGDVMPAGRPLDDSVGFVPCDSGAGGGPGDRSRVAVVGVVACPGRRVSVAGGAVRGDKGRAGCGSSWVSCECGGMGSMAFCCGEWGGRIGTSGGRRCKGWWGEDWFLVLGSWFLVLGSWFLVLGSCPWFLVLGSWFLVLGSWFWFWFLVLGSWFLVLGS